MATEAFAELERGVHAALETYSNVHRGSGHNSMVSTHLFEQARDIVLEHLGLDKGIYVVVFCPAGRQRRLRPTPAREPLGVSSQDIGLSLGVRALAVKERRCPVARPSRAAEGPPGLSPRVG